MFQDSNQGKTVLQMLRKRLHYAYISLQCSVYSPTTFFMSRFEPPFPYFGVTLFWGLILTIN